jgi:hypothetical protein
LAWMVPTTTSTWSITLMYSPGLLKASSNGSLWDQWQCIW